MILHFNFFLKEAKADKPTLIMLRLSSGCKNIKISTGIKVLPKDWSQDSMSVKRTCGHYNISNGILLRWKQAANEVVVRVAGEDKGLEEVKNDILILMGKKDKPTTDKLFLPYYEKWSFNDTTKREATRRMAYSYRLFVEFLGSSNPTFDEITMQLSEQYIEWMANRGLNPNTRGGHMKRIKAAMREAYDQGLHTNTAFTKFRKETEKVENIYLSSEEIRSIEELSLIGAKAKARDLFVIGCYTALRYSDIIHLSLKDIDGNGIIHLKQEKTEGEVAIPCAPAVLAALERNGGEAPSMALPLYNRLLKEICREAGICEVVGIKRHGEKDKQYFEKWELVSSHTARRSAATNMYKSGIPAISIMKITGHTSEKIFLDYIKISKDENAHMLKDAAFFR